jgi:hypothetical protein
MGKSVVLPASESRDYYQIQVLRTHLLLNHGNEGDGINACLKKSLFPIQNDVSGLIIIVFRSFLGECRLFCDH